MGIFIDLGIGRHWVSTWKFGCFVLFLTDPFKRSSPEFWPIPRCPPHFLWERFNRRYTLQASQQRMVDEWWWLYPIRMAESKFHRTIRTIRTMLMKCWKLSWSNMWQLNISEKVRLSKTIQNYFNYHSWQPSTEPVKIPLTYPISWNTSWLIDFPFYIIIIIPE